MFSNCKEERPKEAQALSGLTLTAIGIVFGDIGTSPLYTLKTVLALAGGTQTPDIALGLLSLIIWTLLITVSVKYVTFVMRVDNHGEGGILALMSLLRLKKHRRPLIMALGLFGAALIYGDGAITPAISVLSAVEGLKITEPSIAHYILPISVAILFGLFAVQSFGTARIGWVFGPIMISWFLVIGALGVWGISQHPAVLVALNPQYGIHYLLNAGATGFMVLGGVFLAVTGAEALYADMGHVGAKSIRLAWYGLVLPALLLNYAGQTALILGNDTISDNIFYRLCPPAFLLPLIGLATVATIIASQAIITGAFSMTRQAIQLGWCPPLKIIHTSAKGYGQIYVGTVNWLLMAVTIGLTVAFGSSDNLAAAYGIAVSLTMLLTTVLMFVAMREIWRWNILVSSVVAGLFFCIDATFFSANLVKVFDGGWVPLVLAVIIYTCMQAWRGGSVAVAKAMLSLTTPIDSFIARLTASSIPRVPGTAIFLSKTNEKTPPIIIWHVDHNKALHEHVVALSIVIESIPFIEDDKRIIVKLVAPNLWRIVAHFGFMEKPDIPKLLYQAQPLGCTLDLCDVTYYVGHETILHCTTGTGMPLWKEKLYAFMRSNSGQLTEHFYLPYDRVVEIGHRIVI